MMYRYTARFVWNGKARTVTINAAGDDAFAKAWGLAWQGISPPMVEILDRVPISTPKPPFGLEAKEVEQGG